jgi:hypothetical protein
MGDELTRAPDDRKPPAYMTSQELRDAIEQAVPATSRWHALVMELDSRPASTSSRQAAPAAGPRNTPDAGQEQQPTQEATP